jgi:hypothetical protein
MRAVAGDCVSAPLGRPGIGVYGDVWKFRNRWRWWPVGRAVWLPTTQRTGCAAQSASTPLGRVVRIELEPLIEN